MAQRTNRRVHFAPDCQGNLFGSFDELGLDDDRGVRASVNMEDRVGIRVVVTRRTLAIVLLVSICCCRGGVRIVVVMGVSLVAREHHQVIVHGLGSVHLVKMHGPRSRCAGPGNKRNKGDRKDFAKQAHGRISTALGVASL
jgi:hypothetical protein